MEGRNDGESLFDIYTTHLHVCLSFILFYKFPFDRLATKLPFFCNNSQCSTLFNWSFSKLRCFIETRRYFY